MTIFTVKSTRGHFKQLVGLVLGIYYTCTKLWLLGFHLCWVPFVVWFHPEIPIAIAQIKMHNYNYCYQISISTFVIRPTDVQAPVSDEPSTHTVMTEKSHLFSSKRSRYQCFIVIFIVCQEPIREEHATHPAFTHLPLDKMATILLTTFSNTFIWMKSVRLRFEFHWSLFPRVQLTISQHWFRKWLGAEQATSHYLNQCWPSSLTHICGTRGRWLKIGSNYISEPDIKTNINNFIKWICPSVHKTSFALNTNIWITDWWSIFC